MLYALIIVPLGSLAALFVAWFMYRWVSEQNPGNKRVQELAGYIRKGAVAYLKQQYKTTGIFFLGAFVILLIFSFGFGALSRFVPFAFLTGAFFSGLSGFLGMMTSTKASCRTTHAASNSLNDALKISFRGGSVLGLVVVGLGLLDIIVWFIVLQMAIHNPDPVEKLQIITTTMLSFGFGASAQALFARVGGGIFTKAADMGADLVGKVEAGIPEDDPRNPAVIADNVGDNVGDVAGMGADLYESYVSSTLGAAALGVSAFAGTDFLYQAVTLPMIIAALGTVASIFGIYIVRTKENAEQIGLLKAINRGINFASVLTLVLSALAIHFLLPGYFWSLFLPIISGLAVGVAIGYITDFYTNAAFSPVKKIAMQARTGHATVITSGLSVGFISTAPTFIFILIGMFLAFWTGGGFQNFSSGLFAIGLASVGMLSTLGINLTTDGFGPIADNAGGLAEMAEMSSQTRKRTDSLDELGNSTAARGKGLCVGAAALTAITLIAAFVETIRTALIGMNVEMISNVSIKNADILQILNYLGASILDIRFIIGLFIGGILGTSFISKTIDAVSMAAGEMIDEVRRQFHEIKGVMTGETTPDYSKCVQISTLAAQKKMVSPAVIVILTPIVTGLLLGPVAVMGLLIGNLLVGIILAIFMANAGGAWDNAKKYIERTKSELRFQIDDGIKKISRQGLWPFYLTHETNRFLYELVNLNPLAFSIDEEVSEYMGQIIEYVQDEYIKKGKDIKPLFDAYGSRNVKPYQDEHFHNLWGKLNNNDKFMFREFLKLAQEDHDVLLSMRELNIKFRTIMESYHAAVTGDTVGDPLKDTSGPSMDIAVKLATMVSIITIGLILRYNLAQFF
ncbi:MAG: sodium-translocating pyrophosphatase [Candidatus Marinimicrobia bacterium]|nr:sodium-translocating pyrophosphatase [Candidatus Neomarinimicrobiota bacterium]